MNIRILSESDARLYQDLRLNALKANPEAFGSTYEREVDFPIELVKERIRPLKDRFVLGAFNQRKPLVGTVTFIRETSLKTEHKGNVFAMYVAPDQRGQGIGTALMKELVSRAKQCDGLEQLNLMVAAENETAKKLYSSMGFVVYGTERNALKYNGRYFDEDLMVLTL